MNNLTKDNERFTTIKEVSEIFKVSDETVRRAIKELFPEKLQNGKTTYLNEYEVAQIKNVIFGNKYLGTMNPESLHRSVEVTVEAEENQIIAKAQSILMRRVSALETQIAVMKPKSDFYDAICDSKDAIEIGLVAKSLNIPYKQNKVIGRNQLFELLRDNKILDSGNIPYQKYIDAGYFRTIEQKYTNPNGETKISIKTVVYQKGVNFIRGLITRAG